MDDTEYLKLRRLTRFPESHHLTQFRRMRLRKVHVLPGIVLNVKQASSLTLHRLLESVVCARIRIDGARPEAVLLSAEHELIITGDNRANAEMFRVTRLFLARRAIHAGSRLVAYLRASNM